MKTEDCLQIANKNDTVVVDSDNVFDAQDKKPIAPPKQFDKKCPPRRPEPTIQKVLEPSVRNKSPSKKGFVTRQDDI